MRDYGKVHATFWTSPTTSSMSDDGRMLALYLLTSQHATIAGVFRLPDGYAIEDLHWTPQRVSKGFAELFEKGFANRCETTKWVWVHKHLKWNRPENPNQCKSAAKVAMSIPDECSWKPAFMRDSGTLLGIDWVPPANPQLTLVEPLPNQKQEQEQKQKQDLRPMALSAELPTCPVQDIVKAYHEVLPELPAVRLMNPRRKAALQKVWRFVLTSKKSDGSPRAETSEQALTWLRGYFERTRDNDFLMGRTGSNGSHANWRCDLDFLLTDRGMSHVIEKTREQA